MIQGFYMGLPTLLEKPKKTLNIQSSDNVTACDC